MSWLPLLVVPVIFAACLGGVRPPPHPLSVEPPEISTIGEALAERPVVSLEPRDPRPPPHPWLTPVLRWTPAELTEGSVMALFIDQPAGGRRPWRVEAELPGASVHLIPRRGGWFGLAPLPIMSAGSSFLRIRFYLSPDSVVEAVRLLHVRPRSYPAIRLRVGSSFTKPSAETVERLSRERALIRKTLERVSSTWNAAGGFDWPRRSRITSPFGQRRLLNGQLRTRHMGLDLAGRRGAPVRAAAGGRVVLTGKFLLQGNAVYLDHGYGVFTAYFHLSRIAVREGERVSRGQPLGSVGSTGRVTGPHLHWSFYVDSQSLDPTSLLKLDLPEAADLEIDGQRSPPVTVR